MIYDLQPRDAALVRPLLHGMEHHLAIDAVLSGAVPGRILVDDPAAPQVAMLFTSNPHRVYLAGVSGRHEFNRAARSLVAERASEIVVYAAPGPWNDTIDTLLPAATTERWMRQYWTLRDLRVDWRVVLPEGMQVRRIDARLLEDDLRQRDELVTEIHSESPSVEHFLQHSFGSCVQAGDALVAWCLSEYNRPGRCELGIETLEPYRRRGLALVSAAATLERASVEDITEVGWHCWANNVASSATAARLGFEKVMDYSVWYCRMEAR